MRKNIVLDSMKENIFGANLKEECQTKELEILKDFLKSVDKILKFDLAPGDTGKKVNLNFGTIKRKNLEMIDLFL